MKVSTLRDIAPSGLLSFCNTFTSIMKEVEDKIGTMPPDSLHTDLMLLTVYTFKRKLARALTDIHHTFPAPMSITGEEQLEGMVRMAVRLFSEITSQWRDCDVATALTFEVPAEAAGVVTPMQWMFALVAGETSDVYEVPEASTSETTRLLVRIFSDCRSLHPVERGERMGRIISEELTRSAGPADQGSGAVH